MRSIRDCKVAVVGGAGFLGSHLVNHLIEDRNCNVLVIDNLVAGRREFIHPKADFEHHDITGSEGRLLGLLLDYSTKFVFNYAAYPYIPVSFDRPLYVFDVNCFGAIKVINAAQEAGCEAVLQVSSAEIYGGAIGMLPDGKLPLGSGKIDEQEFVIPHSSYGASKAAVDAYCQVAWKERKTPVIALRQFNCIGERDVLHPYVLVEIMRQLATQSKRGIVRLGNNSSRDFLYTGDAVKIAVELLEKGQFGEVYNSGSEKTIKIYDLAKLVGQLMGFESVEVQVDESRKRPWEIWTLQSCNNKLYSTIDYRPQTSLKEAIKLMLLDVLPRLTSSGLPDGLRG